MKINPVIIDYGVGNLYSLRKAIEFTGFDPIITNKVEEIEKSSHIFLPGVGSFYKAVQNLKDIELFDYIKNLNFKNKKIMGICLGMQLLFESSEEDQFSEGLSLIKGNVKKIKFKNDQNKKSYKIPNIGWFKLKYNQEYKKDGIIRGTNLKKDSFYFVHSYCVTNLKDENLIASIDYNNISIPAIVKNENIFGTQFHPEKSREFGLNLIKNFLC